MSFAHFSDPDFARMTDQEKNEYNSEARRREEAALKEKIEKQKKELEDIASAYYQKIEAENSELKKQKLKEELEYLQRNKQTLPKCFNPIYYENKAKNATTDLEKDYYLTLQNYINKARVFFTACIHHFAEQNNRLNVMPGYIREFQMPENTSLVTICSEFANVERQAKSVIYKYKGGKIETFIKNSARLSEVVEYSMQAYLIMLDMKNKNYLKDLNTMYVAYKNADLEDENQITKFKAGQIRVKYKVDKNFYDYIDNEKIKDLNATPEFYKNLQTKEIYFKMLDNLQIFNSNRVGEQLQPKLQKVKNLVNIELINLFSNRKDINYCINQLTDMRVAIRNPKLFEYQDVNNLDRSKADRDLFSTAEYYYYRCEFILNNIEDPQMFKRAIKDIQSIKNLLQDCIDYHKTYHEDYLIRSEENRKEFENSDMYKRLYGDKEI